MTLPGETVLGGANNVCGVCGEVIPFTVCMSPAGYYVGTWCCEGPNTRESGYYRTSQEAHDALDSGEATWRD